MGSTEANFFGIRNARDYLSGKSLLPDPNTRERARSAIINENPQPLTPKFLNYQAKVTEKNPNMYTPIDFFS